MLGLRYDVEDSAIVVLNNLSPQHRTVTLDISEDEISTATDLFTDRHYGPIDPDSRRMRLNGNGYRWLRLRGIY